MKGEKIMAIANMKASFTSDIAKIWKIVTSCEDYEWRSDLSKIGQVFFPWKKIKFV